MSVEHSKIRIGIIGGAGYAAGEALRILLRHPHVDIAFAQSVSNAGKYVFSVHKDLVGETDLLFEASMQDDCDVLLLCLGHGQSRDWVVNNPISSRTRIIDLSQDFRYSDNDNFIYGLPELYRDDIRAKKKHIANPGCFATAIQLALLPLAQKRMLHSDMHITAITGSTGAGQTLSASSHFSWRSQNVQIYKPFQHQHLREIEFSLQQVCKSEISPIYFIPIRGNFTRGIHASIVTKTNLQPSQLVDLFTEFYSQHPFVTILQEGLPDLKMAVQTNKCIIGMETHKGMTVIASVIDNLIKGASGQAIQNMNILFEFPETAGLLLKPSGF